MNCRLVVAAMLIILVGRISLFWSGHSVVATASWRANQRAARPPAASDRQRPTFDPLQSALARSEPQPIYSADPEDAWNQTFFLLFTRTVSARLIADGAPLFAAGDERLTLSSRRVTRIESGDRAIDPLYPSWLWMDSTAFDFDPATGWRILGDPQYWRLMGALDGVRRTALSRSPLARALMQADLWSTFDMLHAITRPRQGRSTAEGEERRARTKTLLLQIATTMRALALSSEEIAKLPDTYSAAARSLGLPDLLGSRNGWMEIRWLPDRSHDYAAMHRRAARVFFRAATRPGGESAFLNQFRTEQGENRAALDSVALLIQLLLVSRDGRVVPSRITYEVQFRGSAAQARGAIPQYELSRRQLLSSPASGGLVAIGANAPAYLPIAGNDFSFAAPPRLDAEAVVAPLERRCAVCHGTTPTSVGHLMTFSKHTAPDKPLPPVERLVTAQNVHARDVARKKMESENFKALREHWR